ARFNALFSPDSKHYFEDAARLREKVSDPKMEKIVSQGTRFAVLRAAFGTGAYGFFGPNANFVNKEPMTLRDAKKLLEKEDDSYSSGLRLVPAPLMAPELTERHGGILAGTNYPCNEIERFMQNGGNLDELTVLVRKH